MYIIGGSKPRTVLCDFGLSEELEEFRTLELHHDNAMLWWSPELIDPLPGAQPLKTPATDMWAFGIAVYEVSGTPTVSVPAHRIEAS